MHMKSKKWVPKRVLIFNSHQGSKYSSLIAGVARKEEWQCAGHEFVSGNPDMTDDHHGSAASQLVLH